MNTQVILQSPAELEKICAAVEARIKKISGGVLALDNSAAGASNVEAIGTFLRKHHVTPSGVDAGEGNLISAIVNLHKAGRIVWRVPPVQQLKTAKQQAVDQEKAAISQQKKFADADSPFRGLSKQEKEQPVKKQTSREVLLKTADGLTLREINTRILAHKAEYHSRTYSQKAELTALRDDLLAKGIDAKKILEAIKEKISSFAPATFSPGRGL